MYNWILLVLIFISAAQEIWILGLEEEGRESVVPLSTACEQPTCLVR
jgi:hypothetical protein